MNVRDLLEQLRDGRADLDTVEKGLKDLAFESTGFANIDHHRRLRRGFPEVLYCEGKTPDQSADIFQRLAAKNGNVLATRADNRHREAIAQAVPQVSHDPLGRCVWLKRDKKILGRGTILIVTGGTADLPVAQEAMVTAEVMGNRTRLLPDVGVAGLHRLLAHKDALQDASVVVAVAGMEGALPGVVGGLIDAPVIGVPTSVGYGASFKGVSALLTMLNACSSGVTVVNIDNGFGAAFAASLINRKQPRKSR